MIDPTWRIRRAFEYKLQLFRLWIPVPYLVFAVFRVLGYPVGWRIRGGL